MLVFTLVLIIAAAIILMKAEKGWTSASILKVLGLTLIIGVSTLLVIAGYSTGQIGPVMGLLGVIAGYLLGDRPSTKAAWGSEYGSFNSGLVNDYQLH